MADTKNVSVTQEEQIEFPEFQPTKKEKEVVSSVFYKFRETADHRNQSFENFDGLNLVDYIEDSVQRFITNIDEREGIEDWQARVNDQFTRNKVYAVLGKVVQVLPVAEFVGRGDEDIQKGQILTNLYEYSEEIDDYEEFLINFLIEAIVKGTAIGFEGHEKKTRVERKIVNGDVKKNNIKVNRLYGQIVKLEDFYPANVGVRKIKDMPYCFWRTKIPHQQFLQDFSMFKKASEVKPQNTATDGDREDQPFYADYINQDVQDGHVEVIRYYNRDVDEYIIVANDVWLNPVGDKMHIAPLPFKHKELPFWEIRFESFGGDFFYGKSLPDKLKSTQDVLNVLTNMLLDQSFLTIFPPLLTNGFDSIEDDYLRPGRRTPIDTQGVSIKDAFMKLDLGTPSNWHQFILEYTRKVMEEASVDKVSQGVAGVGERTTASEIRVAAEGVVSMLSIFARLIKYGIKRKALLRGKNILQFWTDKNSPILEGILGLGGSKKVSDAFNIIKLNDTTLSTGKRGIKVIEMFANKEQLPTRDDVAARESVFRVQTGKNIEIVSVTGEYIRNLDFDIKLVQNPKSEQTKEAEKAIQLEKVRVYLSFFPELVDKQELFAQTAEKLGDDPTKIIKENILNPQPDEGLMNSERDSGVPTQPQGNIANNTVRGARGGETQANELSQIQNNITG